MYTRNWAQLFFTHSTDTGNFPILEMWRFFNDERKKVWCWLTLLYNCTTSHISYYIVGMYFSNECWMFYHYAPQ